MSKGLGQEQRLILAIVDDGLAADAKPAYTRWFTASEIGWDLYLLEYEGAEVKGFGQPPLNPSHRRSLQQSLKSLADRGKLIRESRGNEIWYTTPRELARAQMAWTKQGADEAVRRFTGNQCVVCGRYFAAKRRDARFCSTRCRVASHRHSA